MFRKVGGDGGDGGGAAPPVFRRRRCCSPPCCCHIRPRSSYQSAPPCALPCHPPTLLQAAAQRLASSQAAAALGRTSTFPDNSSGQASTSGRQLPTGFPSLPGFPTGFPTLPGLPGGGAGAGALAAAFGLGGGGGGGGTSLVPTSSLGLAGASVDFEDSHTREALRWVDGCSCSDHLRVGPARVGMVSQVVASRGLRGRGVCGGRGAGALLGINPACSPCVALHPLLVGPPPAAPAAAGSCCHPRERCSGSFCWMSW